MRKHRHVSGDRQVEEEVLQLRRRGVMRRLNQHVARISDRQELARSKSGNEVGGHVDIRTGDQAQRNSVLVERVLQRLSRLANRRPVIVVETRQDVRRTGKNSYALRNRRLGHRQRDGQIARAVVDSGQDMAMQINHRVPRRSPYDQLRR
jgi:hypothetical protein